MLVSEIKTFGGSETGFEFDLLQLNISKIKLKATKASKVSVIVKAINFIICSFQILG